MFFQSFVRLKERGAHAAPLVCKHNAPIMLLKKERMAYNRFCKHSARIMCLKQYGLKWVAPLKTRGFGGGATPPPPPHMHTQCSHDRFVRLKPPLPHLQTRCSHAGFQTKCSFKAFVCICVSKMNGGVGGGAAPPICKHNARIMRLEKKTVRHNMGGSLEKKNGGLWGGGGGWVA